MSVCRTDALAAWRSEQCWCTREDLNLHALRRPLLRRLRLPFRHECIAKVVLMVPQSADRTPVSALPKRCPATGRLRLWCWLEDLNLPPLAYEASALPDELSQRDKLTKRIAAPLPEWKRPCGCARLGAASKSGRSQCQRARRHRRRSHRRTDSWDEGARTRAHALGTRVGFGCTSVGSAGHLPSCLSGGGGTLRRLFRFQPRALLAPIEGTGGAPIAARAHEQPTVRSIRPSGGGAERGGDM